MEESHHAIILFDGYCNLCNSSVDLIMRNDRKQRFKFASLQGEFGSNLISTYPGLKGIDSVVLYTERRIYTEMDAAMLIGKELGFPYTLLVLLKLLPKPVRNSIYRFISRNRYKWFGKKETCRVPTKAERSLFID